MPSIYRVDPAYEINKYLLAELYESGVLEQSDYLKDGIQFKPIFPVQQPAPAQLTTDSSTNPLKLNFGGEPFLVYDVAIPEYGSTDYFISQEQIMYSIYARDFIDVREVQMACYDIFHRLDDTAREVNILTPGLPFTFHYVSVIDSPPPAPKKSPDDPAQAFIMIEYQYARKIESNGRFAS